MIPVSLICEEAEASWSVDAQLWHQLQRGDSLKCSLLLPDDPAVCAKLEPLDEGRDNEAKRTGVTLYRNTVWIDCEVVGRERSCFLWQPNHKPCETGVATIQIRPKTPEGLEALRILHDAKALYLKVGATTDRDLKHLR